MGRRRDHGYHVFSVNISRYPQHQPIIFTSEDKEGVFYLHDDPIVVVVDIDGFTVKRILVDSGNSCNMLT